MKVFLAGLVTAVGLASLVQAGPLQTRQVSADAKWLVHVD